MNRLLVYGDSWPYGAGLNNPELHSFPIIIGKLLALEVHNFSEQGTSVDHAVYSFISHYKHNFLNNTDKVLFCITSKSRSMIFDQDNCAVELHPRGVKETDRMYYKYFYSEKLADLNLEKNILLVKLICDLLKIQSFFVANWEDIPCKNHANFYHTTLLGILHSERVNLIEDTNGVSLMWNPSPYLFDHRHPNEKGHQKIAEELSKWIN